MDDNELISPEESGNLGESGTKLKNNGAYRVEDGNDKLLEEINTWGTEVVSPSVTVVSLEGTGSSSSAVDKRQGLKKWRRIPRELAKKTGSSRSSSAARDSRMQNEISNLIGANSGLPDDHKRNGGTRSGKKARGFKIEKENSNSTMGLLGSDSRSSNFVFVQGGNTVASKGRPSGNEESSDDKDLDKESQTTLIKSGAESDDLSLASDNIGKHERSKDQDPLVESITGLQFAQEEFEREVLKWRDVGKDDPFIFNDPIHEILQLKDARILELDLALSSKDVKNELEDYLMKTIQADVEHVVITATTKRLTDGPLREIKHKLQQKKASSHDMQATKKQDGNSQTKENLKNLQNRVCRFTSCFMFQLILLLVTFYMKFSPQKLVVVPT